MSQTLEFTPSLFFQYAKSPHWIWYDIYGDQSKKNALSEFAQKMIDEGVLHEQTYIQNLNVTKVDATLSEEAQEKQTLALMKQGVDFIYQGVISYIDADVRFKGRPDILKKCVGSSKFGDYFYRPIEIKSSIKCEKPEYKKQLMLYAIMLGKIQGFQPIEAGFINKNKESITCDLTEKLLISTNETISEILKIIRGEKPSIKITSECKETPWYEVLLSEAKSQNDIALIYKLPASALEALRQAGISTLNAMATCDIDSLAKIKGTSRDTLHRAKDQAISLLNNQIKKIATPNIPEAKTKIYFDIEGDPLLGVQYLFGLFIVKQEKEPKFTYFIAEKPEEEGAMWFKFLEWLQAENLTDFKVYHFHHYEKTYLNKLLGIYGDNDKLLDFIDNLVDLSPIVLNSFIFPVYFYSIKDIAKHLKFKWQHEKAGGGQSIFWYEQWLETNDRTILQDIINYNEDDVKATEFIHRWMLAQ